MTEPNDNTNDSDRNLMRNYDRQMLRSTFQSLICAGLSGIDDTVPMTAADLAETTGQSEKQITDAFKVAPNWTLDEIADLVGALGIELQIKARNRKGHMLVAGSDGVKFVGAEDAV